MADPEERSSKRPSALVVGGAPAARRLLRRLLEREGLAVREAARVPTPRERLDAALELVVVADAEGGPAGPALVEQLRERCGEGVPIAVATSSTDAEVLDALLRAGAAEVGAPDGPLFPHRLRALLRTAHERRTQQEMAQRVAEVHRLAGLGTWEFDLATGRFSLSEPARNLLGFGSKRERPFLTEVQDRIHPEDRLAFADAWRAMLEGGPPLALDHRVVAADAAPRPLDSRANLVLDEDGEVLGVRGVSIDRRAREGRQQAVAGFQLDRLTGLASRALLEDTLRRMVARASRRPSPFAVLHLGLDGFRRINEAFGRFAGDEVLRGVAQRLTASVEAWLSEVSDGASLPTLARVSGDEFTILIPELSSESAAALASRRILDAIARPFRIDDQPTVVTASIGIAIGPGDGSNAEVLLQQAVEAMHHAKDRSRNHYQFHAESRNREAYATLILETRLRGALQQDHLTLHYQPKVDAGTRRVTGVEALIRWNDPELGAVPPSQFVPIAENSDLIVPIGRWALRTASAQIAAWRRQGIAPGRVAVNVSPRQFRSPDFVRSVISTIHEAGARPEEIELEITEGCLLEESTATATLRALRDRGLSVAVDDFGTGYSSLQYLRQLPIDCIKIDRAFVKDLSSDETARSLTVAIISLAWSLGLRVVAEGVESEEEWEFLRDHGCDEIQGFAFSRPLPAEECEALLRAGMPAPSPRSPAWRP